MGNTKLYVYRVGHGLCTLLHATKSDGTPYNAVFDCGSLRLVGSNDYNGYPLPLKESIAHMAEIIRENGNDHLDLLVNSHQDVDHNNMFYDLIKALNDWDQKSDGWIDCGDGSLFKTGERAWRKIQSLSQTEATYEYKYEGDVNVSFNQCIWGENDYYIKSVSDFKAQQVLWFVWGVDDGGEPIEHKMTFSIEFGFVINEQWLTEGYWQNIVTQFTDINFSIYIDNNLLLKNMINGEVYNEELTSWYSIIVTALKKKLKWFSPKKLKTKRNL